MKQTIHTFIQTEKLLQPTDTVIVAVSGGADSVALLHLLQSLGYKCIATHCNFHLRAAESDRDELFVKQLCHQLQIQLHVQHFQTKQYAEKQKISIEMAARELRYAWFEKIRLQEKAQAIAVAHQADDQVETILMNLVRGTGLRGLCGMSARNGYIIRPLLGCSRSDIENYLRTQKMPFIIDSTNNETIYKRNKFRHEVIPLLETINPNFRQTLLESQKHYNGYWATIQNLTSQLKREIVIENGEIIYIDIKKLQQQTAPETILYELLQPYSFNSTQTSQLWNTTQKQSGKIIKAKDYIAIKDRQYIIVYKKQFQNEIPELKMTAREKKEKEFFPPANANIAFVDAEKLCEPLTLRHWKHGDTFKPIGCKGNKKVSDFFTDLKLDIYQKEQVWILLSAEKIVWIVGYRISDEFKITSNTTNVIEISLK